MIRFEYIEIEVPNLSQAITFYCRSFCMRAIATYRSELKTSYLLQHGNIKLVISEKNKQRLDFSNDDRYEFDHVVKEIAFLTEDVEAWFENAVKLGQEAIVHPFKINLANDNICMATVAGVGDVRHTFIQRSNSKSNTLPYFQTIDNNIEHDACNIELYEIDHIAVCVNEGDLDKWVKQYESVFGFAQSYEEYVVTANSGMNSKVVKSKNGPTQIVFVAPIPEKKQSQITDYLNYHGGPCIQHLAFSTNDIINTVKAQRQRGVEFLSIPNHYYEIQQAKLALDQKTIQSLRTLSILVDQQKSGYLYQIFTKPFKSKPTLFFEIIQRMDCDGFGSGNIKALFQAIEKEQLKRDVVN